MPNLSFVTRGAATYGVNGNTATITQTSNAAILNWQSFNVGAGNLVQFVQPGASSAALNRIWQADPSRIAGSIKANGQIYLVNQNGIVFANGAQVNVGSLVASSLDITDDLFVNGILSNVQSGTAVPAFTPFGNGLPSGMVSVENGAALTTASGGRIMLLAPAVQNNGVISTPDGQTVLAAGQKVYVAASSDPTLRGLLVEVDNGGSAQNLNLGQIIADRGNATIVGLAVNQAGRVSATTSINANGSITLRARDTVTLAPDAISGGNVPVGKNTGAVTLGTGSVTEVRPDPTDTQTSLDNQPFNPSTVSIVGKSIELQSGAAIVAPGGKVSLTAQAGLNFQGSGEPAVAGVRVYLAPDSTIDVSGLSNVAVPIERNVVAAQLRGAELADDPQQRGGFLQGKTVYVDARLANPTPLANVAGYTSQIPRTVAERLASGGSIVIKSEGDIVLREGSTLNVSGGSINYLSGYLKTTRLTSNGRIYDIGSAPANVVYDGFADSFTVTNARWGVTQTYTSSSRGVFTPGYVEGKNAGSITLNAHGVALDGRLRGNATVGPYQRDPAHLPLGGALNIGDAAATGAGRDYRIAGFDVRNQPNTLPAAFDFSSPSVTGTVTVPASVVTQDGFSRLGLFSNGTIDVAGDVNLAFAPGGTLTLAGRRIDFAGSLNAPGGTVSFSTADTFGTPGTTAQDYQIRLSGGAALDTSGQWVNDLSQAGGGNGSVFINGGSVTLNSTADAIVSAGARIDVSGGGWLQSTNKLKSGDAGSISIASGTINLSSAQAGQVDLSGELAGYALGSGGTLSITAPGIAIGGSTGGAPGTLALTGDFFQRGGFKDYNIKGLRSLTVADDASVAPLAQSFVLNGDYRLQASGSKLGAISQRRVLPVEQRKAQNLTLATDDTTFGQLTIGEGARVQVDAGGSITLAGSSRINMFGTLEAPAGAITLSLPAPLSTDSFDATQSIWLGANSQILARGAAAVTTNNRGLRQGTVADGGRVAISAGRGYIVGEAGALVDVSGASATIDLLLDYPGGPAPAPTATAVASNAGSIALKAREGILFDGMLSAKSGGAAARGGALSVALESTYSILGSPAVSRDLRLVQSGSSVPAGLQAGQPISNALNGQALVAADGVKSGGFDDLSLASSDRITIAADTKLSMRRSISFDAPVIAADAGADATLGAAYVALGNLAARRTTQSASGGSGTLTVSATQIDLGGTLVMQGFDSVNLTATEDIRGIGILSNSTSTALSGGLTTGASELKLTARQVYPAPFSDYKLEITGNPLGTITFDRKGADTPVLSAGGILEVNAPTIVQNGALKAPFGEINLTATNSLTLGANSLTSISAEGQLIPFGKTDLSGSSYGYTLGSGNNLPITTPPQKTVRLDSKDVNVASGAKIDVSGGGDVYAYEFVPGPGGTKDLLDPVNAPGSFAVLPGYASSFAPFDTQLQAGNSAFKPGDRIYLSGGGGLGAGTYTLLPSRYALLPGAFLVTAKSGTTDLQPSRAYAQGDGTYIASGYRISASQDGSLIRDPRSSGFVVQSGALVRRQSEYLETRGSEFFAAQAGAQLPGDAGRLVVAASQLLVLDGSLLTDHANGRQGAEVDITAPKLAIVSPGGAAVAGGFVSLSADSLTNLKASSLLLGGTRSVSGNTASINVGSSEVVVANSTAHPLSAPEIILAATDKVTVSGGSAVVATDGSAAARDITIGNAAAGVSGEGVLLRTAVGAQVDLVRNNINATNPGRGTLLVEANAQVSGHAVILDATKSNSFGGDLDLGSSGALALGANRISAGDTGSVAGGSGLVFSNDQLAALGQPTQLLLRSYTTLDLFGAAAIGNASLESLAIQAGGIGGYQNAGQTATLQAKSVTLSNTSGVSFSNAPALVGGDVPALGGGDLLQVTADTVKLGAGSFEIKGYTGTTVSAGREVVATAIGELKTPGDLTIKTTRISAASDASYKMTLTGSAGVFSTTQTATPAIDLADAELGGKLGIAAATIKHGGRFDLPSGLLELKALGPAGANGAGSVTLLDGSQINAGGANIAFFDVTKSSPGGEVRLSSVSGNVMVAATALVDVSGADGAGGGTLAVSAVNGSAQLSGLIKGGANALAGLAAPQQGTFSLDVGTLADFGVLNVALNPTLDAQGRIVAGGFTESREIRVRSGDVSIGTAATPAVTVKSHDFRLAADTGSIDLYGAIDASGAKGGSVLLAAAGNVTMYGSGNARIDAHGTEAVASPFGTHGEGGSVTLAAASATGAVNMQANTTIDVTGAGAARGGQVLLRAQRNLAGNDVPVTALGTIAGARDTIVEGYKVYTATTISGSGATDGVNFSTATTGTAFTQAASFITNTNANASGVRSRLSASALTNFHLRPGVEVDSPGPLTISVNEVANPTLQTSLQTRGWNLAAWRFNAEPGVLTIRASGDINVNSVIGDGFNNFTAPNSTNRLMQEWAIQRTDNSWSYRIVAGADLAAASPLATNVAGTGNLTLADNKLIRTGNGSIDIAAGGNVNLAGPGSAIYTAGVRGPNYADYGGADVSLGIGVGFGFPQNGGDVNIRAGGDINAVASEQLITTWFQRQGKLVNGVISTNFGDQVSWWPRFDSRRLTNNSSDPGYLQGGFRQGVGALGGGDVTVTAAGSINNLAVSTPTNGRQRGTAGSVPDPNLLMVQGGGDIAVTSGGDINSAIFFVDRGRAEIVAGGSVGQTAGRPVGTMLALGDGQINVTAARDITIDAVFNPTVLAQGPRNDTRGTIAPPTAVFFTYTENSAVDLAALGDVKLANRPAAIRTAYSPPYSATTQDAKEQLANAQALFQSAVSSGDEAALAAYPGTVRVSAMTGDISIAGGFSMYPAARGNLELLAQGAVNAPVAIAMSDSDPARLPQPSNPALTFIGDANPFLVNTIGVSYHANPPLHSDDAEPVRIYAATGDVTGGAVTGSATQLPKQARVLAGGDVKDFWLYGQNLGENDVTRVAAGRDVVFTPKRDDFGNPLASNGTIEIGGPGRLEVIAGRNIDLGTSNGIITHGNLNNTRLPEGGATVMTLAGAPAFALTGAPKLDAAAYLTEDGQTANLPPIRLTRSGLADYVRKVTGDTTVDTVNAPDKFNALPADKQWPLFVDAFYTALRDTGRAAVANGGDYSRGIAAIAEAFPGASYRGDINLFFSQIKTEQGGDIQMLAPGGTVNAGLASASGIAKSASALGIITVGGGSVKAFVNKDFLVNQSRVFTLGGGDILIWSSDGNIDAGKGAKTASATPPPQLTIDAKGNVKIDISQSVSGSGIGVLLAKQGITPGDVDLIAPKGEVNAGDAGIRAAGNITIAAVRVVGADNIQVGGRSSGVPAAESGSFASALTGTGNVGGEASRNVADQAARNSAAALNAQVPAFRPTFISVEILGFGEN